MNGTSQRILDDGTVLNYRIDLGTQRRFDAFGIEFDAVTEQKNDHRHDFLLHEAGNDNKARLIDLDGINREIGMVEDRLGEAMKRDGDKFEEAYLRSLVSTLGIFKMLRNVLNLTVDLEEIRFA